MGNKSMSDYTLYCTPEQTRKAFELGAPLNSSSGVYMDDKKNKENHIVHCMKGNPIIRAGYYIIPTAEQMIGFLEEQGLKFKIYEKYKRSWHFYVGYKTRREPIEDFDNLNSRKEATLAAIDAALEYLANKK